MVLLLRYLFFSLKEVRAGDTTESSFFFLLVFSVSFSFFFFLEREFKYNIGIPTNTLLELSCGRKDLSFALRFFFLFLSQTIPS